MTTLYLSGPMAGLPGLNHPAFHAAARKLRAAGYRVINPAENTPPCPDPQWADWLRLDVRHVTRSDGVATLPGWENSPGARLETDVAARLSILSEPVEYWIENAPERVEVVPPSDAELQVYRAWTDPGKMPMAHYDAQFRLSRQWPTLYDAVVTLVDDVDRRTRD